ncbi:MAG: hypothetical protein V8Q57_09160 [Blautia sp.]
MRFIDKLERKYGRFGIPESDDLHCDLLCDRICSADVVIPSTVGYAQPGAGLYPTGTDLEACDLGDLSAKQ